MKVVATRKEEQNRAAVDPWTLVHFASGLALGLMGTRTSAALGAAVGYELFEQYIERQEWGQDFFESAGPESPANAVVDVVAFLAGHWAGRAWNATETHGTEAP